MGNSKLGTWASKLKSSFDRWLESPEEKRRRELLEKVHAKTCELHEKDEKISSNNSGSGGSGSKQRLRLYQEVPRSSPIEDKSVTTVELCRRYAEKGVDRPGALVQIYKNELEHLIKEDFAREQVKTAQTAHELLSFTLTNNSSLVSSASSCVLGMDLMDFRFVTTVPSTEGNTTQQQQQQSTTELGAKVFEAQVYLVREWTTYMSIVDAKVPLGWQTISDQWIPAMFLGVEHFDEEEVKKVKWRKKREHGDEWIDAKWGRWLIGDQIYVGWIHPGAMRKFSVSGEWL